MTVPHTPGRDAASALTGALIPPVRLDFRELDHATSPMADLDAFVNARWRAANPLPRDRSCWDCFTVLAERSLQQCAAIAIDAALATNARTHAERVVADFWRSGMHAEAMEPQGLEPLRDELARIETLDSPAAIAAYVGDRHARGWGVLFNLEVSPDFEQPTLTIAGITQGGLGLPDCSLYGDDSARGVATLAAYRAHVASMLALDGVPLAHARSLADAVVGFETRLARVSLSRQSLARDVSLRYRRVTLEQADRETPMLSWGAFFTAQGINAPAYFSLPMPAFHAELNAMLQDIPIAHWQAYLRFHTIDAAAPHLDEPTAQTHHRFHGQHLRGQGALAPRWKRVLRAIDTHIGEAMGELYLAQTLPPAARASVERLAEHLRLALHRRIERLDWMTAATKAQALRKLAALRVNIGGPQQPPDASALETSATRWHANLLAARTLHHRRMLARLGQPMDRHEWTMLPQTVNARYDPLRNEIVFPAAILQPPFFDPDADDALNFGGIGAVIAHEMTHAFDDQGSRFDADGRFVNWWNDLDRAHHHAHTQRLVAQFEGADGRALASAALDVDTAGSPAAEAHERVNGQLTLGENIADFGGLAIACDALQHALARAPESDILRDGFRPLQRFFLNWAALWRQNLSPDERRLRLRTDPHAPAPLRANAAAANLAAFGEAFGGKPGDPMWRASTDRLGLW
jgi:putative endopeptidase